MDVEPTKEEEPMKVEEPIKIDDVKPMKNPKRVAAGKKGSEARKAKHAATLAQLLKAKTSYREKSEQNSNSDRLLMAAEPKHSDHIVLVTNPIAYVISGMGIVAAIWLFIKFKPQTVKKQPAKTTEVSQPTVINNKLKNDPHKML
jgi:hypothetical protein